MWPALHNMFTVWIQPHLPPSSFPFGPGGSGSWLSKPWALTLFVLVVLRLTDSFVISLLNINSHLFLTNLSVHLFCVGTLLSLIIHMIG